MVWLMNKLCLEGFIKGIDDVIVQRIGIIFSVHTDKYDAFEFYRLWCSGVNMFNVDLTKHDIKFFNDVKEKLDKALQYTKQDYYRPMGITVIVSIQNAMDIGENVDVVILKDVETLEDYTKFRKENENIASKVNLVWLSTYDWVETPVLIKLADGIVIDFGNPRMSIQECSCILKHCRDEHKPIILNRPYVLSEYGDSGRSLLVDSNNIAKLGPDAMIVQSADDLESPHIKIYKVVTALAFSKKVLESNGDVAVQRNRINIIMTPPLSAALAASMVALYNSANAIIVFTRSGRSARWISVMCPPPNCFIIAITTKKATSRVLHIYRKVIPVLYNKPSASNWQEEWRSRVAFGTTFGLKMCLFCSGAKLVVLAPAAEDSGYCNSVQIVTAPFRCPE